MEYSIPEKFINLYDNFCLPGLEKMLSAPLKTDKVKLLQETLTLMNQLITERYTLPFTELLEKALILQEDKNFWIETEPPKRASDTKGSLLSVTPSKDPAIINSYME